jgi:predicted ArsR family transcriptional regulator
MRNCLWRDELKGGWSNMLLSRLSFHNSLTISQVAETTNRSKHTVRRHFQKLVDNGQAEWMFYNGEHFSIRKPPR